MKTIDEWHNEILACSYHLHEVLEDAAMKDTIRAIREEFRQACMDAIKAKIIPIPPPQWESVHDEGVNMGLERAISAIEEVWMHEGH